MSRQKTPIDLDRAAFGDTDPETYRLWVAQMRERGIAWRIRRFNELTTLCRDAARRAVDAAHPEKSAAERDWIFLKAAYGRHIADETIAGLRRLGDYDDDDG